MNFTKKGRTKLTKSIKSTATYLRRVQWLMINFFICNIIEIVSVTYQNILKNELHIADSIRVSLPRGVGNWALRSYCLVVNQFNQIILGPNAQLLMTKHQSKFFNKIYTAIHWTYQRVSCDCYYSVHKVNGSFNRNCNNFKVLLSEIIISQTFLRIIMSITIVIIIIN